VTAIVLFFVLHWQLSVFFQSFFHHRYGAHRQFTMSKPVERVMHFLAWAVCGASYLNPRAYAVMHRMHHAYSDTPRDPHSPVQQPNLPAMMMRTLEQYTALKDRKVEVEPRFDGGYPEWKLLDETLSNWWVSLGWGTLYTVFYLVFAPHWWMAAIFAPIHWLLGPIHGAIVNWAGHKLGYRNYDSDDNSKNTLVFDVLTMGELFQNNHHKWGQSPDFGVRWFEIDPAYQMMRVLAFFRVIDMSKSQKSRWVPAGDKTGRTAKPVEAAAEPAPVLFEPAAMDGE
jgi:stearoyl-CoA desaturase (delta-9 desaturase)